MMQFSSDSRTAEQEMHAVIYYLTAFGYVDGDFDQSERAYVKDYIQKLVAFRARDMLGDEASGYDDVVVRWTKHFHEIFAQIDQSIHDWYTESVGDGETTEQFVIAKLKLRCFELFKAFDEAIGLRDQAQQQSDLPALRRLAHSLKSVWRCLGFDADSGLAAQVEDCAARQQADAAWAHWPTLRARLLSHAQPSTEGRA